MGRLAFTGFWMLIGSVGPLVLTNASDPPGVILEVAVLAVGVGRAGSKPQGNNADGDTTAR